MTAEENKVLMHRFIEEIMNGRNLHGADEFFADDFVDHQGGIGPTGGREAVKAFVATLTGDSRTCASKPSIWWPRATGYSLTSSVAARTQVISLVSRPPGGR